jgi:hypothetical protein
MAQPGNDNQKSGVVSDYPDNVHQGVVAGGDNYTPLSMATSEDGDDVGEGGPNRDQRFIPGRSGWVIPEAPGIE